MDLQAIKKALPHVDEIYVKDGEWFIHFVPDAEVVNLNEFNELNELNETIIKEAPSKKNKLK